MKWTMAGTSEKCTYQGEATVRLDQGDDAGTLKFDLKQPGAVKYSGSAGVAHGPEIVVAVDCGGTDRSFVTRADGDVWFAPMDMVWPMLGPEISGSYRSEARIGSTYTWSFAKVK